MKTIYLVRHAKSSWENPDLHDDERPLLPKGIKKTKLVCKYLKGHNVRVDRIITSYAVRAFETSRIIASCIHYPESNISIDKRLYENGVQGYFNVIYELPDNIGSVMLFGHNPAITSFANKFIPDKIDIIPTSGIVCINYDTDKWEEIDLAEKTLQFYIYPRKLK